MRVQYGDDDWKRLACDPCCQPGTLSADLVRSYREQHQVLVAAESRADLAVLRCLDLRTEGGHHASIRLSSDARLLLDFDEQMPAQVTVVGIVQPERRR